MRGERLRELRGERPASLGTRARVDGHVRLALLVEEVARIDRRRQGRGLLPRRQAPRRALRADRGDLGAGDDGEERPVAHDSDDARLLPQLVLVDGDEPRGGARRTDHAPVHHAFEDDVLDVRGRAVHFVGQIAPRDARSDDRPPVRRFRLDRGRGLTREQRVIDEVGVADRLATGSAHDAIGDLERRGVRAQTPRGPREQQPAQLRGDTAHERSGLLHRAAARGVALIRTDRRIGREDLHPIERDVELVRHALRERGADPLPDLDLAGEERHRPVLLEPEPAVEPAGRGHALLTHEGLMTRAPRRASRAGSAAASRSGRGCRRAHRASASRSGAGARRAALSPTSRCR